MAQATQERATARGNAEFAATLIFKASLELGLPVQFIRTPQGDHMYAVLAMYGPECIPNPTFLVMKVEKFALVGPIMFWRRGIEPSLTNPSIEANVIKRFPLTLQTLAGITQAYAGLQGREVPSFREAASTALSLLQMNHLLWETLVWPRQIDDPLTAQINIALTQEGRNPSFGLVRDIVAHLAATGA